MNSRGFIRHSDIWSKGSYAYVRLRNREGKLVGETCIDAVRLGKVMRLGRWRKMTNGYVATTVIVGGKRRDIYLHRFLMDVPDGAVVDHINGDPLDNRLENLRVVHHAENMQNLTGPRSDSSTGALNVSRSLADGRYKVVVNRRFFGRYTTLNEAKSAAQAARIDILPYSRERSEASRASTQPVL